MAEFVSKSTLYKMCDPYGFFQLHVSQIDNMPAEDAEPVVRGHWMKITKALVDTTGFCSVCREEAVWRTCKSPYFRCPHCGAKMDKEG